MREFFWLTGEKLVIMLKIKHENNWNNDKFIIL